jgi:glyoxylase-like metal-dependent hydrolase (beta-lactamase superfamily II)
MGLPDRIQVLQRGWLSSNQVLFFDDDGASVLDSGYVSDAEETLRLVGEALGDAPLKRLLNTHIHSDHAGGNALLQAHHDCLTLIPPGEAEGVAAWDTSRLSHERLSQDCPRFRHDGLITPGDTLLLGGEDWTVLAAPGHDHAMVMLWCARLGILASADALWEKGFGVIFPELEGVAGFAEQAATVELIGQLAPRLVIPGHGAPFSEVDAALLAARSRIQWLTEDPRRNADNALKVLVAFKLLAAQRLNPAEQRAIVQTSLDASPGLRALGLDDADAVVAEVVAQLMRAGVGRLEDGVLVSVARG